MEADPLLRRSSRSATILIALVAGWAAEPTCPPVNFLTARTINLRPSSTSHITLVRQDDGSYTGYENRDASPYQTLEITPHFERQFSACLPHSIPDLPSPGPAPLANPPGAASQNDVAAILPSGNYLFITNRSQSLYFAIFDRRLNLISENQFTAPRGIVGPRYFSSLVLADLNGDGALDLVALGSDPQPVQAWKNSIWTFLGNGDGTFQPGKNRGLEGYLGATYDAGAIAVGDFNGDGKPDIALVGWATPSSILLGSGDGTFGEQIRVRAGPNMAPALPSVAVADLNGDGKLDLVISPYSSGIAVALGNGDGTFQPATEFRALTGQARWNQVAVGDVNGDGIPDIVTASGSVLFGDGKGGFPSRRDYLVDGAGPYVMLADFDGDGQIDIIIGSGNANLFIGYSLAVLFNRGGGDFATARVSSVDHEPLGGPVSLAAADFDRDGIPDVVYADYLAYSFEILKGDANGDFSPAFHYDLPNHGAPSSLAVADLNRDGNPDLVVAVAAGYLMIFLGKGDGTLATPAILAYAFGTPSVAIADLNGDGRMDLVVTSQSPFRAPLLLYFGKGDGTFSSPASYPVGGTVLSVAFGDFDGDGRIDIAAAHPGGIVSLLFGMGDGSFSIGATSQISLPGSPPFSDYVTNLMVADFNGDGRRDLAMTLCYDRGSPPCRLAVLIGNGDGTFQSPIIHPEPTERSFVAGDFNCDGNTDLIMNLVSDVNALLSNVGVLLGNGDGTFQTHKPISRIPLMTIAAGDFNRDGKIDRVGLYGLGLATFFNLSQDCVVFADAATIGGISPTGASSRHDSPIPLAPQTSR
jgi:hypothetical protein